jgi:methylmalonyl-CoA mutase C-terminal domain/subunit
MDKIRILITVPGIDGHDWGAIVVAQACKDAGMEVIYAGVHQTPEMIVSAAIAEDVDAIGLSLKDSSHMVYFPKVAELLKEKGADHICIIGGGIVPEEDKPLLEAQGITGNFNSGTPLSHIVQHIQERVKEMRKKRNK